MNTASAIKLSYSEGERKIEILKGEVFSQVRSDRSRPFRVIANDGLAEAVGTAYSVRKSDDKITVTVTEGKVSVYSPEKQKQIPQLHSPSLLGPGYQIDFGPKIVAKTAREVNVDRSLAWRSGKIIFDDTPLADAIKELGRYYPGRIVLTKGVNKTIRISGVFPSNKASSAIRAIAQNNGISVTETVGDLLILLH